MSKRCILCQRSRKNLRFHELPSNPIQREKWLELVPTDEFPRLNANPKICELHFLPSDYAESKKYRNLYKWVVPRFLPREEPKNEEPEINNVIVVDNSKISVETTEICVNTFSDNSLEDLPVGLKKVMTKLQTGAKRKNENVVNKVGRKMAILRAQIEHLKEENREKARKMKSLSLELKELKTISHRQASEIKSKDKSLRQLELKVQQFRKKLSDKELGTATVKEKLEKDKREKDEQIKKIRSLKEQVDILSTERKEMEQICYYKNIEEMILNMDTDRKASFILDQIRLYKMKLPRYADSTLQECIIWEDTDPRGYQFVRESELLTLPSQHTMKKHLGPMDIELVMDNGSNNKLIQSCINERNNPLQ